MSNPDPHRAQLDDLQRRIQEHPAHVEYWRCQGLKQTLNVFQVNAGELMALLEQAATDAELAMELVQNVRPPEARDAFRLAVLRELHNYVASAMTLVDHSRRMMRDRSGPIADELEARKEAFLANPEVKFVQDLRNFTLHRELPPLGHRVSMQNLNTPDATMVSEVQLSVESLSSWDGWAPTSVEFLNQQGDAVELRQVIERHRELVIEINAWLLNELVDANADSLDEVNELIVERNAVLAGVSIEEARQTTEEVTRQRTLPAADEGGPREA
jgi:hypothetical protein